MILRVRSPLGMARFDVSEEDSVTALRGKILAQWPDLASSSWSLRLEGPRGQLPSARGNTNLLASTAATAPVSALDLRHGDMVYLDVQRDAPHPVPVARTAPGEAVVLPRAAWLGSHANLWAFMRDYLFWK
ncbi:uncharacterized protein EHS24_001370 [Apiotrichum porosum]|uniref:Nuclear pore localisation protein Npl4 ubiquitin-like domain-containing protein n=1 Tax=Apiotrichum porosum TaxID=105984 RepID=A0A427XKG6_9TREE|nr:uncharacterized protein EHS24_001370 [Apiotrichum porosum]RSH79328.1 hypothetical protein EHS24_001370 [Apiotrichum porosum]